MKRAIIIFSALLWPLGAVAAPDYTYVQAEYIPIGTLEISGGGMRADDDYDGFSLEAVVAATSNIFFLGEFNELENDDNDEVELLSLGVGLNHPLAVQNGSLDVFGTATFESIDLDDGVEGEGFGVTTGLRWLPNQQVELAADVGYVDYGELDNFFNVDLDGFRFGIDGLYSVNEVFALVAGYRLQKLELSGGGGSADLDLENEFSIGGRIYLAK